MAQASTYPSHAMPILRIEPGDNDRVHQVTLLGQDISALVVNDEARKKLSSNFKFTTKDSALIPAKAWTSVNKEDFGEDWNKFALDMVKEINKWIQAYGDETMQTSTNDFLAPFENIRELFMRLGPGRQFETAELYRYRDETTGDGTLVYMAGTFHDESEKGLKGTQAVYILHYNCRAKSTSACCGVTKNPVSVKRQNEIIEYQIVPLCYADFGAAVLNAVKDSRHYPLSKREKLHDDCNMVMHIGNMLHALVTAGSSGAR